MVHITPHSKLDIFFIKTLTDFGDEILWPTLSFHALSIYTLGSLKWDKNLGFLAFLWWLLILANESKETIN